MHINILNQYKNKEIINGLCNLKQLQKERKLWHDKGTTLHFISRKKACVGDDRD
jgi:hypothetical protein